MIYDLTNENRHITYTIGSNNMKNQVKNLTAMSKYFNKLTSDYDRFRFLLDNPDFMLMLDNDSTHAIYSPQVTTGLTEKEFDSLPDLADFDYCLGNDGGVFILLRAVGIRAEGV